MPIVKTEAVILKCDNFRETSKIVTFYSKNYGKLRGIAKGVRSSKTRWGGALQSMAYLNMIFYLKENRTLHLISGAEYVKTYRLMYDNFEKLQVGYRIIELINRTTEDHSENAELFALLTDSLENLDCATKNYVNVLFNFEFRLLKILGFEVSLDDIADRSIDITGQNRYFYDTEFTPGDRKVLNSMRDGNFNSLMSLNISKSQESVMESFFENYFKSHFDHAGYLKTKKVFKSGEMYI